MEQLVKMSIYIHMAVAVFLILSQLAYFLIKNEKSFIKFSKKFRNLLLIQNIIFGMTAFTGVVVMAVTQFTLWNLEIFLMIFLAIGIFVYQIILYKKIRPIKSIEKELQEEFKKYASKIYLSEAVAGVVIYILARIL
ncbi:hypothetical protein [Nitrosophilus labii]|uniref:hypothetical protein n=1 Tax=Nitrosophilus labii TaxID=2706014 RepID=UPI0016570B28|nr:hypothetical protein [Nitrosophilus labii]